MLDLRLEYRGAGAFQVRSKFDLELCEQNLERMEKVRAKVSKARSVKQNRMFHGLVQAAFMNQRGGPILPTWEHLRAWLLIRADHCDVSKIELKGLPVTDVPAVVGPLAAAFRRGSDFVEVNYDRKDHALVLRTPKKWRFSATDSDTARDVFNRVLDIIATEIVPGVEPTALLGMAKELAA